MGNGETRGTRRQGGQGGQGGAGSREQGAGEFFPNAPCPMTAGALLGPTPRPHSQTYAQCPMPNYQLPITNFRK
ncbi:hypothetical protein PI95_008555 [Hassallia byssoidea VB512170]|uniref:Uncharacterized protein n=1 Tax=Hassallia byssoidea VB512170 TaxID=1304833 RepID=A0A846H4S1_9CYAN|nr:hypothetical protein [Hassalia byssoidea]NEU72617.1 hypothetical protein [Hassalia byssoidea VB512170]